MGQPDDRADPLVARFERHRPHLHALAQRMLGSASEAQDAVRETWLRLARADTTEITNLAAWLTTVTSRLCLEALRDRVDLDPVGDPAQQAVLVESVGRALLVVLGTLRPHERVAFVLHFMFGVPLHRIAQIVERSEGTTRGLVGRAGQRVHGTPTVPAAELHAHRRVVDLFLAATRGGDLTALLAVLASDVVRRADPIVLPPGGAVAVQGARSVLEEAAVVFVPMSPNAALTLVNGDVGLVVAPHGRLRQAVAFVIEDGLIAEIDVIADPARLAGTELALLD